MSTKKALPSFPFLRGFSHSGHFSGDIPRPLACITRWGRTTFRNRDPAQKRVEFQAAFVHVETLVRVRRPRDPLLQQPVEHLSCDWRLPTHEAGARGARSRRPGQRSVPEPTSRVGHASEGLYVHPGSCTSSTNATTDTSSAVGSVPRPVPDFHSTRACSPGWRDRASLVPEPTPLEGPNPTLTITRACVITLSLTFFTSSTWRPIRENDPVPVVSSTPPRSALKIASGESGCAITEARPAASFPPRTSGEPTAWEIAKLHPD
jgi:hypothetical protein